jgi:hypothetical protein
MTLQVWEGMEHCTANSGVSRHNSLDADSNYGNDDEEKEVKNRFHNASSLEFGGAQLTKMRDYRAILFNEICYFFTRNS